MNAGDTHIHLNQYRTCLGALRREFRRARPLPAVSFYLFGMGPRRKLIYQAGALTDALTGERLYAWQVQAETILPSEYRVILDLPDGSRVHIWEDETGIRLEDGGAPCLLSSGPLNLPRFEPHRYAPVLRVLHQEILVNILNGAPLPNFFVYPKPWYRDAAMMAMVLRQTANLHLIRDWILGLREPYDRNNAGECEADNLGQALYLVSLVTDASHLLVPAVLAELPRFEVSDYLKGNTDFAEHPLYQTKWARFGLAALGLPDPYQVPVFPDSYSSLFWWDYRDRHAPGWRFSELDYPYLDWAEAHFYAETSAPLGDRDYPLSWESRASQANYAALARLSPAYVAEQLAAPHTWHAAEMFLYLLSAG